MLIGAAVLRKVGAAVLRKVASAKSAEVFIEGSAPGFLLWFEEVSVRSCTLLFPILGCASSSGSSSTMSVSSSNSEEQKSGCATGEESSVWAGLRAGRGAVLAADSALLGAGLLAKPAAFCAELATASAAFEVIFS